MPVTTGMLGMTEITVTPGMLEMRGMPVIRRTCLLRDFLVIHVIFGMSGMPVITGM